MIDSLEQKDKIAPLVSVLLPSYNHVKFVEQAVLSILNQSYPNIELLVIDDGSTDGSHEILENLSKKHGFFYQHQENMGVIKTLERLSSLAKGKYISFFSSDDLSEPEKIEKLVSYLEKNPDFSMVYSKIRIIDANNNLVKLVQEPYKEGMIFKDLLMGNFFINGLGAIIKTEAYRNFSRFDCYIDDYQLWLSVAKKHKIGFVDDFLASYRIHDNHLASDLIKMQQAELRIISRYENEEVFPAALNEWNLRWLNLFAQRNKAYALKFLYPVIKCKKNWFKPQTLKALFKLIMPSFFRF
jgi:alpha-1,3-rhamnosyltransferase